MKNSTFLLCMMTIVLLPIGILAAVIHIPADQPTIQAGIDDAVDGDTILIAEGIYSGNGNHDIDFKGKAIVVSGDSNSENCIINCSGDEGGFVFQNKEENDSVLRSLCIQGGAGYSPGIICAHASPMIDACTIRNFGSAMGQQNQGGIFLTNSNAYICNTIIESNKNLTGGGITCFDSTLTIENTMILNNFSEDGPGGIKIENSVVMLKNCGIQGNCSYDYYSQDAPGGGIEIRNSDVEIDQCVISSNSSAWGGGIYSIDSKVGIFGASICNNYARTEGGGIYSEGSIIIISCSEVSFNTAGSDGSACAGGVISYWSTVGILQSKVNYNHAFRFGGGLVQDGGTLYIHSSEIISNPADEYPSSISLRDLDAVMYNCTLAENNNNYNSYIRARSNSNVQITNSIIWNLNLRLEDGNPSPCIRYCAMNFDYPGPGNIKVNPLFVGGDPFDYHLSPNSPCIDAGTDNSVNDTDIDGNPRLQGGAVDMGAYEFAGWPSIPRAYIKMPSHYFKEGDISFCAASVWNPFDYSLDHHKLFVFLDIYNQIFMAPSFSEFDYYTWSFDPGRTDLVILPEFSWPSVGSASGLVWYTALTNPEMTALTSEIGVFDFGWSE